jgi:hypothetical protein
MWQAIAHFVVTYWKLISFGTIFTGIGMVVRTSAWFKQRGVKSLARRVLYYTDEVRRKNPNLFAFPRQHLAEQLGCTAKRMGEVLEFMEEKGWAAKVRFPVDCWQIN